MAGLVSRRVRRGAPGRANPDEERRLLRKSTSRMLVDSTRGLPCKAALNGESARILLTTGAAQASVSERPNSDLITYAHPAKDLPPRVCQDSFGLALPFIDEYPSAVAGIFDGHGTDGHKVARFVCEQVVSHCRKFLKALLPVDALAQAFEMTERDLLEQSTFSTDCSGSTATVALIYKTSVFVAWIGDSRCVLGRINSTRSYRAYELTKDHNPSRQGEYDRIQGAGGRVQEHTQHHGSGSDSSGPVVMRVWNDKEKLSPGLAMTRSFGDAKLHSVGVVSDPEISSYKLNAQDSFIILASDGVWGVFKSDEAVSFVARYRGDNVQRVTEAIVTEAARRWQQIGEGEDISCVIIFIDSNLARGSSLVRAIDIADHVAFDPTDD